MAANPYLSTAGIYQTLKDEIINLELEPGTFIGEIEISKRFNISRTPIREVFKRLEYDGLINIIKNKGTQISPINLRKILDLMFIREKVEIGILEESLSLFTADTIIHLSLIIAEQSDLIYKSKASIEDRAIEFYKLDNLFHETLCRFSNRPDLWKFFINLLPDYSRFRVVSARLNTDLTLEKLYLEHAAILQHIKEKDLDAIKIIYKEHIFSGITRFEQLLESTPEYFIKTAY
ncbi:GntR family transcriptional regulator [Candidatus Epulonipiscium viviparus]|uniref:GntR family transcriptional regulator n=1 Tax=Candidatus Epulonipiscium viviparus TaxID=420336 RepID=UPI00016C0718|nr:GntR family transcriptional regulator [Candidatus Epulopiscium viviparus]